MTSVFAAGFVIAVFVISLATARAESACDAYGEEYQTCRDGNTRQIVECVTKLYKGWEKRLDAAQRKLLAMETEPTRTAALKKSQAAWLAYRNENCEWYEAGEGTIHRIWGSECMRRMTACRALELEEAGETN
jgi:uncharacterized protein YecT (DUF1311 family)